MKKKTDENYLEKVAIRSENLRFTVGEDGLVTLEIDNKGIMNRLAQKLLKKPPVTYIHLDEIGSFVWLKLDGEKPLSEIGGLMEEALGEKAQPTYERLAKFAQILDSYHFITWK
jgi:hypothetical protein